MAHASRLFLNALYVLLGGYAVGYYGYPRTTADMDVWVAIDDANAAKLVRILNPGNIVRMGLPPVRIEVLNQIDRVKFGECAERATNTTIDGIPVRLISLEDLPGDT